MKNLDQDKEKELLSRIKQDRTVKDTLVSLFGANLDELERAEEALNH